MTLEFHEFNRQMNTDLQRIGELEGVEEGVAHDRGTSIVTAQFEELGHHLGSQDASAFIRQLDGSVNAVRRLTRLDAHVEFT